MHPIRMFSPTPLQHGDLKSINASAISQLANGDLRPISTKRELPMDGLGLHRLLGRGVMA